MLKPGLIVVSGGLVLALSGCGIFDGVDSVVRNLSGAADKNQGSYRAPLAIPPDYDLRPPPNRSAKKVAPAAKTDTKEKAPEKLDTVPTTAKTDTKTDTKAGTEPAAKKPEVRPKGPTKLVIKVPDRPEPKAEKVPTKKTVEKKTETRRVVVTAPPPPQPSETTGNVKPETRGKEATSGDSPSKGEDELLRKSGVKQ